MSNQPNYKLRDEHVATCGHLRQALSTIAQTYATKTQLGDIDPVSNQIRSNENPNITLTATGDAIYCNAPIDMGDNMILTSNIADRSLAVLSRGAGDGRYVKRTDTLDLIPSPVEDLNIGGRRIKNIAASVEQNDAVRRSELDTKRNITARDDSIQHSSGNAAMIATTANKIDIKVNGAVRGYFQQPVGQSTTPLGLVSTDKLQLQSDLSSISAYGAKPLSNDGSLNTHGVYVTGIDDVAKNVQSTLSVSQGSAQVYISAGHVNPGIGMTDFCAVAANKSLQISGGLQPGITDKQLLLYAANQNKTIPIQADGKMGYSSSAITVTESTQFTSKSYTDAADATRLSLSGGTMTGHINLVGQPELSTHAVNRDYVDQVENSLVKKSGSTMTGALLLHAAPTVDLQASTKKYVDDSVSTRLPLSGGALTGALSVITPTSANHAVTKAYVDAITAAGVSALSATNGYRVDALSDRIRINNAAGQTVQEIAATSGLVNVNQRIGSTTRYNTADAGSVQYDWIFRSEAANRPQLQLQDVGTEGTQTSRITSVNNSGTNPVSITMKPNLQRIEMSAPVFHTSDVTVSDNRQLVTKKYVDDTLTLNTVPARIQNALNTVRMTAQSGGDITIEQEPYGAEYVVLTKNEIRVDNGTALTLNRGTTSLVIRDNNTGTAQIEATRPMIYSGVTTASSDDQLTSLRMNDARYRRIDQNIDLGFTQRLTGLPSPLIPSEPVTLGIFDAALLYFRQCVTFGFTVLEVPSSPEAFASDANAITNITYTETGAGVSGYYTLSVNPALFDGSDYVVTCQWASTRSGVSIVDSQVAPLVVGNYQRTSFTIYARDTTGGTQQNQILGTLTRRGW